MGMKMIWRLCDWLAARPVLTVVGSAVLAWVVLWSPWVVVVAASAVWLLFAPEVGS